LVDAHNGALNLLVQDLPIELTAEQATPAKRGRGRPPSVNVATSNGGNGGSLDLNDIAEDEIELPLKSPSAPVSHI
jgi:hypothetical protein